MSLARSVPGKNETLESSIINVSFDETLCPHVTHSISQNSITIFISRSITLEANAGSITLEGNLGDITLD
jgi:hypothetical protein